MTNEELVADNNFLDQLIDTYFNARQKEEQALLDKILLIANKLCTFLWPKMMEGNHEDET